MEFIIDKCAILVMKSGKGHMTEEIELPNPEKIRTVGEKETNKYWGILVADTIKHVEMRKQKKATWDKTIWRETYKRDQ